MSKHLSVLYQARLVESRKDGRWIYFRLPNGEAGPEVKGALRWILKAVQKDPRIEEDAGRLKRILKLNPSELCKRQCQ
jgi:DNA-binding transcriptional ArsR family regulator